MVVTQKSWKKLKAALKETTRKTSGMTFTESVSRIKQTQRGWLNYFRLGNSISKLEKVDAWLLNRLRL